MSFNLSLKIVGARFKSLRKHMHLKQIELATELDIQQNTISRLENGGVTTLKSFLAMVSFFSKYYMMHNFLSENFIIIPNIKQDFYDEETLEKVNQEVKEIRQEVDMKLIDFLNKFI